MDCPDGFYSDTTGLALCTTCPQGFYCDAAVQQQPVACINNSECDLGLKRQPLCPTGMFTYTSETGYTECRDCSATYYCRAGKKIDRCVAGYTCPEGLNTVPNPSITQCPVGYYCKKGAIGPTRCPYETMSV